MRYATLLTPSHVFETVAMTRVLLLAGLFCMPAFADNWPQWRGPKNDGHSAETGLPTEWGNGKGVLWNCPLPGPGAATPCVWNDRIFLTAQTDDSLTLLCIGTDGKEKWKATLGSGSGRFRGDEGNLASASCSSDGKHVYTLVGNGIFTAHTLDGKEVWKQDLQKIYGQFKIQFGGHWTPVLHGDKLYLQLFHRGIQALICFDTATGKEVWKADRKSDGKGESPDVYASCFVWTKGDKALLIAHGNDYCTAHSLNDGAEVWRVAELNPKARYNNAWRAVSSPLVTPDLIVVPSCKRGVTVGVDPNTAKGTISPGNGELWRIAKDTPDVPSPVLVPGAVVIMGEGGTVYGYDPKSGDKLFENRITNMRHRANPVVADGKVYLLGREGVTVVIKAGNTFEQLASNKLPDVFTASPAISGGKIYLRGWKDLYCIGK
jgi:outer membrane protein assembly factor BamB